MTRDAPRTAAHRAHIVVVTTGGTIANTHSGRVPLSDVIDDVRALPGGRAALDGYTLELHEVCRQGAAAFTPATWDLVREGVQAAVERDDVEGVVVTHGTYTLEETAYYVHLTVATDKPLVFTCSQRKHGTIGNDGDRNLLDALRVAACPDAAGAGVLVVANEEIHSAREVVKTSRRPDGFASPALGPLGFVDEDRVSLYRAQLRRHTAGSQFAPPSGTASPVVAVLAAYPGAGAEAVKAVVAGGVDGIVVQGYTYSGAPAPGQVEALRVAADAGVAVVLVSRGREGRIPREAGHELFVRGDNLSAGKAHVLLGTALGGGLRARADIQHVFDTH